MIIAIDGPSGAGKGAAARGLAERLGYLYFDTGAMYRALGYLSLREGVDPADEEAVLGLLPKFDFHMEQEGLEKRYFVGEADVTEVIRTPEVTERSSAVSAIAEVRRRLIPLQRKQAERGNAVFEGRDMGTTLFPNADVKIFLTARPEVRAHRRYLDLRKSDPTVTEESVLADQAERDDRDSTRSASPLRVAEDAIHLDTSDLTLKQVINKLVEVVRRARG